MPQKDPYAEFVFKTFPESWTSYHTLTTQRKKVSEIRKEADNLIAIGTVGGAVGTITNIGTLSTSLKLAVVSFSYLAFYTVHYIFKRHLAQFYRLPHLPVSRHGHSSVDNIIIQVPAAEIKTGSYDGHRIQD